MELTVDGVLFASLLFALRVTNYSISTLRLVAIARGMRPLAAVMAFFEALIFAVVIGGVVNDLENLLNITAYCLGASAGSYVGMWLEARFVVSYSTVTIIMQEKGREVADLLRENNFGVTVSVAEGRDGPVEMLRSTTTSKDVPYMMQLVREVNPNAFIETESARSLTRGWIPGGPPRRRSA